MLQMATRENKATEREKQGVERNVLALDWSFTLPTGKVLCSSFIFATSS